MPKRRVSRRLGPFSSQYTNCSYKTCKTLVNMRKTRREKRKPHLGSKRHETRRLDPFSSRPSQSHILQNITRYISQYRNNTKEKKNTYQWPVILILAFPELLRNVKMSIGTIDIVQYEKRTRLIKKKLTQCPNDSSRVVWAISRRRRLPSLSTSCSRYITTYIYKK